MLLEKPVHPQQRQPHDHPARFEEVQEAMAERVRQHPQIMGRRKAIIEHCFGTIKRSLVPVMHLTE